MDSSEPNPGANPLLVQGRPKLEPRVIAVARGIYTVFGLSLANSHAIEGPGGLVVVDSGHSAGEGAEIRRWLRTVTGAPVRAVLYTHSHYVRGTTTLLDGDAAVICGHPGIEANVNRTADPRRARFSARRVRLETGADLPLEGPDAVVAPAPSWKDAGGFVAPGRGVVPGDGFEVGGVRVEVLEGCFDTDDGLAFRFPQFDTVAHNLVVSQFPNFGSLGGGLGRDPEPWLRAVEALAHDPPEYLLPCHGLPLSGRERVRERLSVNARAIRHLHEAVLEGLAAGATVPDLVRDVRLPEDLARHEDLRELYGAVAHTVAAIALRQTGIWNGERRELLPLHPDDEAACLARALGGAAALVAHAREAVASGELAWALRLADAADRLRAEGAADLVAECLTRAGRASATWTVRNVLLSVARASGRDRCDGRPMA